MTQAPTAQSKRKRPPSNSSESASRVRVVRLIRLANILLKGGRPVSRKELQEGLEVARATLTRDLTVLRDQLNMPIVYDAMEDGYYLARDSGLPGPRYVLPGVWLDESQAYAVLALTNVLMAVAGPMLAPTLRPLRMLTKTSIGLPTNPTPPVWDKISIEIPGIEDISPSAFRLLSEAMYAERQTILNIAGVESSRRRYSLQRFVLTGSGWQVDAYSEQERKIVRIPINAIRKVAKHTKPARHLEWTDTHWEDGKGRTIPMEQS